MRGNVVNSAILVRYGEIGLKGRNRPLFEQRLVDNIRGALKGVPYHKVRRIYGRILIELENQHVSRALERLQRVFGVVGASPARVVALSMEALEEAVLQEAEEALRVREIHTFKVMARRSNKGFPLTSVEINRQLGGRLLRAHPHLKVDLENPDLTLHVEVRDRAAYVYSHEVRGPGGLPVGVSNRGLLLLSGGIDSPVAGWMAASRGIALEAVHFHSFPFTSAGAQQKALDLCALLSRWTGHITLHLVRFTDIQKAIHQTAPAELGVTLMRRLMMRIAQRIARERNIPVLLTGESVGQVASQTLESLAVIEEVVDIPVLRPVVALDKEAIVERAQRIGSYEISIRPYEDCCTLFLPKHPETRPDRARVERVEAALAVEELVDEAVKTREILEWAWGEPVQTPAERATAGPSDAGGGHAQGSGAGGHATQGDRTEGHDTQDHGTEDDDGLEREGEHHGLAPAHR